MSTRTTTSTRTRNSRRARRGLAVAGAGLAASTAMVAAGSVAAFAAPPPSSGPGPSAGTVYTETNQAAGNSVLAYRTDPGGGLTPIASCPTGGAGTDASPNSQGGVTLGDNGRILAVVNGGSDSVSIFSVGPFGYLRLIDVASSGGVDPISVTVAGPWVYALNAGNTTTAPTIAGIDLGSSVRWPVVVRPLNAHASSPEQISFTPNGRDLVVTEKGSGTIDVFPLNEWGAAGPAVTSTLAKGTGPYGFGFTPNGVAVVSDAGLGALSSFWVDPDGTLVPISTDVVDGQLAPCWVALTADGREAFTANAHSGTVSAYTVAPDGVLSLVSPAVQASPGVGDTDLAVAGSTLYIADQPAVDASTITPSGALDPSTPVVTGDVAGTFGLAATDSFGF